MIDESAFAALLVAARGGDDAAVAVLFGEVHPRLLRFLRAREPAAADDLAGEVWMAVATGLSRFAGDATGFRAWVFSIARRRIADHRRRGLRRNTHPIGNERLERIVAVDDPEHEVVRQLSAQQAAELVVATLPADQADVILLRVLANLGVDEVAAIMGRTANWVRVTQHRALRRLASRLGPKLDVMR
jgi:RNA polymerase sigma-70 factor (ECF subfamily)